jgi:hypothetical protein
VTGSLASPGHSGRRRIRFELRPASGVSFPRRGKRRSTAVHLERFATTDVCKCRRRSRVHPVADYEWYGAYCARRRPRGIRANAGRELVRVIFAWLFPDSVRRMVPGYSLAPSESRVPGFSQKGVRRIDVLASGKLEKGGSELENGNLSSQPCGLTNPARQSLASGRKRVLRGEA